MGDYSSYSKEIPIRKMIIKKVGLIDLDGLYKTMHKWFYDNNYVFEEPTSRIRPGTAAGVEYEFKWKCWRKVSGYVKYHLNVWIYLWDAKDIEVVKEGKKIKLTKCRLQIEIDGFMELDWTKRFSKTKLGMFLFWFYNMYILKEERVLSLWWDELYYRAYKLQTIVKEYLDMEAKGNAFYDIW